MADRWNVGRIFEPQGNIRAKIGCQANKRPANAVVKEVAHACDFRKHDHDQCRQERYRTDEAGGKKRNNKEAYALDGIGIDARPIRRDNADSERDPRDHSGHDERESDDDDPTEERHRYPLNKSAAVTRPWP